MDIQSEKLLLIEELLQVRDIGMIEQIRALLNRESNPIVGFEANGKAIKRKDFIATIEQAEKEFKEGKYQTIEELEKESESW